MNWSIRKELLGSTVILMVVAAALILAHPCAGGQAPAPNLKANTANSGDNQRGNQLFKSDGCYECHGYEGQGARGVGPRIGPPSVSLASFVRYVRQPTSRMPPYTSNVISDSDLADIYAFLQSIPKPPAAKSIPLLND